jgi:hypothetical protein
MLTVNFYNWACRLQTSEIVCADNRYLYNDFTSYTEYPVFNSKGINVLPYAHFGVPYPLRCYENAQLKKFAVVLEPATPPSTL